MAYEIPNYDEYVKKAVKWAKEHHKSYIGQKRVKKLFPELGFAATLRVSATASYLLRNNMSPDGNDPKYIRQTKVISNNRGPIDLKVGILADTHIGSKAAMLDELHEFYDIAKSEGVKIFLHAGDVVDGNKVYKGQEYEQNAISFDEQLELAAERYPQDKHIKTYFIMGNHDYSFYQNQGVDFGRHLSSRRPDLIYLGAHSAEVEIDGIKFFLWHGAKGRAYAISYRLQKRIEEFPGDSKPHILIAGHYHQLGYIKYRDIHAFHAGSFQWETALSERLGVQPQIGGWILHIQGNDGKIEKLDLRLITF